MRYKKLEEALTDSRAAPDLCWMVPYVIKDTKNNKYVTGVFDDVKKVKDVDLGFNINFKKQGQSALPGLLNFISEEDAESFKAEYLNSYPDLLVKRRKEIRFSNYLRVDNMAKAPCYMTFEYVDSLAVKAANYKIYFQKRMQGNQLSRIQKFLNGRLEAETILPDMPEGKVSALKAARNAVEMRGIFTLSTIQVVKNMLSEEILEQINKFVEIFPTYKSKTKHFSTIDEVIENSDVNILSSYYDSSGVGLEILCYLDIFNNVPALKLLGGNGKRKMDILKGYPNEISSDTIALKIRYDKSEDRQSNIKYSIHTQCNVRITSSPDTNHVVPDFTEYSNDHFRLTLLGNKIDELGNKFKLKNNLSNKQHKKLDVYPSCIYFPGVGDDGSYTISSQLHLLDDEHGVGKKGEILVSFWPKLSILFDESSNLKFDDLMSKLQDKLSQCGNKCPEIAEYINNLEAFREYLFTTSGSRVRLADIIP